MAERVIFMADQLARQGISNEEFEHLGEPLRVRAREDLRNNWWWLNNVLLYAQSQPAVLADARSLPTIFSTLSRDDINRAATHFIAAKSNVVGASPAN